MAIKSLVFCMGYSFRNIHCLIVPSFISFIFYVSFVFATLFTKKITGNAGEILCSHLLVVGMLDRFSNAFQSTQT